MKPFVLLAALLIGACSNLPSDPAGTLDRVRANKRFSVGLIDVGAANPSGQQTSYLAAVARAAGARPTFRKGSLEPLLLDLKEGRLDLVIGIVSADTPWRGEVAILEPIAESTGDKSIQVTPIARQGENAWIMLLEREARRAGLAK